MGVIKPLNQRIYKFILKNLIVIGVGTSLKKFKFEIDFSISIDERASEASAKR